MDVRLLGPVEASTNGREIELGARKQRAVLAMLALEVGRTVSADRLAEGLWGEEPPSSAPKMVQLYVSRLRRLLEGNGALIVTRGRGYELQLSDGGVDAVTAEQLLEQSCAREALALWRGESLADVADEPFAAAEIRRLEELRLRATESAIEADLEAGGQAAVIGELDALVAAYPLRERLHAQRMLALYRAGRQAEALEAYRSARAALVEQIGVEPGVELRRLQEAILAQDPALDLPAVEVPVGAQRAPPHSLVRWVVIAAAAILLAGVTAFGVIRVLEPDLTGIHENAVGLIDPANMRITEQYAVGRTPSAIIAGGGSVWIANEADGTVSRFDRERGEKVTIPVGGAPAALAFDGVSLWVADSDSRNIAQIDPGQNRRLQRFEVGNAPRALAVAAGAVWIASGVDGRIKRFDIDRGRVTRSVPIGANPSALVAGGGALWVASEEAGTVTRVEPRTGSVVRAIAVGNGPSALAAGEGAIWVVNREDGTLSRIDPATNKVTGLVRVGDDPTAVAAGGGSVWVAGGEDGSVARVDPRDPHVIEKVKTGNHPAAVAVAGGRVWAAADVPRAAHRGGTLRVLVSRPAKWPTPLDWLHPYSINGVESSELDSLAYDGLVAYRRVEGAAGATLVGALATTVPPPGRDGRSYVFTLRRGLRFSDGRIVGPQDFRASMERFLKASRDYPPELPVPPWYAGILGARRCMNGGRCDLSRGIVTDSTARTITIHLDHPDAEFLHKLTLIPASVVPAGSPTRATEGATPPGTGPYRVASWDADRGGVLVRNPYFRNEPSRSRPDGFADRIEVSVRREGTIEAQIAEVQRGTADLAVIANPFTSAVTAGRVRALVARFAGRVHSHPVPTTDWMFLNTQRRPFDSIRVRQAVNLAIDRAHLVELTGGPEAGQPTCQMIPIAFPGYEPSCPYTAHPAPGRGWTAPDMARARRLVATSGRAGERVVVTMSSYRRATGRYFTALLNRLGFRATLRVPPNEKLDAAYDLHKQVQTIDAGASADYLAPSTFFIQSLWCRGRETNLSHLCDRALEDQMDRAIRISPADSGGAWAAADQRIIDLAEVVPMTNRRAVVLVSKRVGNVQHHAQWFTLLDQLWIR